MEQINAYAFYLLGKWLDSGYLSIHGPIKQNILAYQNAKLLLDGLIDRKLRIELDESRDAAIAMAGVLGQIVSAHEQNGEVVLPQETIGAYIAAFFTLEQALQLELGRAPIYFVAPRGVWATRRLISEAARVYEGYDHRVPADALADTNQAGRCLAFNLPTAAGFHIARAVEAVIRRYMEVFKCPPQRESQRNWGKYIEALEKTDASVKVTQHLKQLKDLHRNPMIHPEVTLTMVEASGLWALATSAIQAMVVDMEPHQSNPDALIAAMIPLEP
jgi:hypothetical protein